MEFPDPAINDYAEKHTSDEPPALRELNRETHAKILMPRMLSGHLQGRLLSMISKIINPDKVLEIGTYTGYSAICLAEGLSAKGMLHTIDINDELEAMVKKYISMSGMNDKITTHFGNALEIIPRLDGPFDIVFIDADKINYANYYDLVFDKVRKGGFILADNVLWSGKVIDEASADNDTKAIISFNRKIAGDERVENVLLAVRDGLMIVRKK